MRSKGMRSARAGLYRVRKEGQREMTTTTYEITLGGEIYESTAALKRRLHIGEASLTTWNNDPDFPRPIKLSRSRYWLRSAVDQWLTTRT